jgi:hypothetical protein
MGAVLICLLAWLLLGPLAVFLVAAAARAGHREDVLRGYERD